MKPSALILLALCAAAAQVSAAAGESPSGEVASVPPIFIAAGRDAPEGPDVHKIQYPSQAILQSFGAYAPEFQGGVRVAVGDVNGDGFEEIITAPGPGLLPHVRIFDGVSGLVLAEFFAYPVAFLGGVYVASGDVNGDKHDDIIVGAGEGGPDQVKVFDGVTLGTLHVFPAYGGTMDNGVRVGAGDVNGDGFADIITGPGPGAAGPHVKVFSGTDGSLLQSFHAFTPGFLGGVYVAAGDMNGDDNDDLIVGTGPGIAPGVIVFDGVTLGVLHNFPAYPVSFTGGVRVAGGDVTGDGVADIITGAGPGAGPHIKVFNGSSGAELSSFFAFPSLTGGVFVGANNAPRTPEPTPTRTDRPTATPNPSPTPTPTRTAEPTPTPDAMCCPGDADNSGSFVDANDFIAVQANFGADNGVGGPGDADCSGSFVDANDFIAVQANFGVDCG